MQLAHVLNVKNCMIIKLETGCFILLDANQLAHQLDRGLIVATATAHNLSHYTIIFENIIVNTFSFTVVLIHLFNIRDDNYSTRFTLDKHKKLRVGAIIVFKSIELNCNVLFGCGTGENNT